MEKEMKEKRKTIRMNRYMKKADLLERLKKDDNIEVAERGKDYLIFRYKDTGTLFVNTLLSGNVPKSFFHDSFEYYKKRIDIIDPNSNDFYDNLKDQGLNIIPTRIEGLEQNVYRYLNEKFGKETLEKIIRRCRRYTLKQQYKQRG